MQEQNALNKHIHENEFRLRILLTNECNRNCLNCLNDFQYKGHDYINTELVCRILSDYNTFSYLAGIRPIVSFSGGEPGLHPEFSKIINFARKFTDFKVQVNTNGKVDDLDWNDTGIDLRYHMGKGLNNVAHKGQTAVFIIHEEKSEPSLYDTIKPFYDCGMRIKTFVNYHSSSHFKQVEYPKILHQLNKYFPVSGRFTGVQENRGDGCARCIKTCVTLKALWVFPSGLCSPCPQRMGTNYSRQQMINAYKFHLKQIKKLDFRRNNGRL